VRLIEIGQIKFYGSREKSLFAEHLNVRFIEIGRIKRYGSREQSLFAEHLNVRFFLNWTNQAFWQL
jgi:hypothetical protein